MLREALKISSRLELISGKVPIFMVGFLLTTYETWQSIVYTDRLKSHML